MVVLGTGNRFQTHRLLHVVVAIDDYPQLARKLPSGMEEKHVAHRCGHGRAIGPAGNVCCISPFHTVLVEPAVNQSHKGCKFGSAATCPHKPGMYC